MKAGKSVLPVLAAFLLWGCTAARPVHMDWMFVDGSRGTGALKLAIMWNPQHDRPEMDIMQAQLLAGEKCRAWGYQDAMQVGTMETQCTRKSSGMLGLCIRKEATLTFHCTSSMQAN
ncbi:MAG: hypothetical protein IJU65_01050 [Desulfovibrio sp.]|nr:hypothetical protein [Desulfovibrio sp.]